MDLRSKLEDMIGSAKKALQKNESVIGLDIGSSFLKVVQVRKDQSRAILETYGELALGPYAGLDVGRATNLPVEKIVEAGKDIFREANVTTKVGSVALPLSAALLTLIEIPAMEESKLPQIIPIEARKYIPVPITEVALDWIILPKSGFETEGDGEEDSQKKEKFQVMIVAIHNQVLNKYQNIVAQLGVQNPTFEIEVYSSIRATIGHDMSPIMFLDMGAGMTKLSVVEQGIIKNVHIISRGSQEITLTLSRSLNVSVAKAESLKRDIGLTGKEEDTKKISGVVESSIGYIFAESNRVLLNYQSKNNRTISKVILTGGGVLLKGLPDYAKKWLSTQTVFGDPFAKLETPAFLVPLLKEAGPEFSVSIGLALKKLQESN
ncbi:type IV pilus assembly protein PilM [bacterium]|nr:type IV pilus assembly protein PilM [bacterium]